MSTLLEKLNKEELLNVASSNFDGSFNLVNAVIDVDNPDKESIKQVLDNENVLKGFIDLTRTLEIKFKFSLDEPTTFVRARVWYAIILILHNKKVPDALNQKIAENEIETINYYKYLKKQGLEIPDVILKSYEDNKRMEIELQDRLAQRRRRRMSMNESSDKQTITEALDKEELKQAFLKSPNTVFNYVKKHFLSKNENPPEEFINAIAQSSYTSKKYIDITIHTELKAPKILIQRIIQDGDMSLNLLRTKYNVYNNDFDSDFPDLESISDQDLLKSITKESHLSFGAYQIYKGKGIKIPLNLWKSILSSPTASLYVARELLKNNEPIPEAIIKGVASKVENAFAFAFDLLKERMDLPETLLKTLSENPDMARIEHNFDNLIITYAELGKEIPDILIDGAANKKWRDTDLSNLCLKFASKGLKIPDKILDIFIEKTPKYGVVKHLGKVSYDILNKYIEYAPWNLIYRGDKEAFKIIPSKLYQYVITPDVAGVSRTKNLITGFLTNFNKIPEDFKQTIIDNYKECGHKIPKDIADAAGIKQPETINEKLDKGELLNVVRQNSFDSLRLAKKLLKMEKEVPDETLKGICKNSFTSFDYARHLIWSKEISPEKLPINILNSITQDSQHTYEFLWTLITHDKKIPDILINAISKDPFNSKNIAQVFRNNKKKVPDIIQKTIDSSLNDTINEKLNKEELLNTVFDSWTDARSMIFDLSKMGKEIPDKLAILAVENMPASILTFVATDIINFGENKVPEIILKGISKNKERAKQIAMVYKNYNQKIPKIIMDALNPKQKEFYNSDLIAPKKTIEEKLDKNELLDVVGSSLDKSDILDFAFNLLYLGNELPDNILKIVSDRPSWAIDHVKSIFSKNKVIDTKRKDLHTLLKSISEDVYYSGELIKFLLRLNRSDIPDVLLKSVARNGPVTNNVVDVYIVSSKKIPIILQKTYQSFHKKQASNLGPSVSESQKTITEKLDKEELLGVIQKDYDAYIDIMNHYFWKKKEYPPEEFLKMATETDEASRIFAEYCLEHKKDIPEDVIKKVAENPRSAYTIAALMILEERKVPEILIKSIHSDPLSLKQFREFVKNEESRFHIPTSYYAKI